MFTSWLKLAGRTAIVMSLMMLVVLPLLPSAQAGTSTSTQNEYDRLRRKELLRREMNDTRREIKDIQAQLAELGKSKQEAQKKVEEAKETFDKARKDAETARNKAQAAKEQTDLAARELAETRKRLLEGMMFTEPSMSLKRALDVARRNCETAREDAVHQLTQDAQYTAKSTLKQEASDELQRLRATGAADQERMTQLITQVMSLEQELAKTETQYLQNDAPYLTAKAKMEEAEKAWKAQESENTKALEQNEDSQALAKVLADKEAANKTARDEQTAALKNIGATESQYNKTRAAWATLESKENDLEKRQQRLETRLMHLEREYQSI